MWSSVRIESVAEKLGVSEPSALRLAREAGAVVVRRAGALWVYGKRPRWTVADKPPAARD